MRNLFPFVVMDKLKEVSGRFMNTCDVTVVLEAPPFCNACLSDHYAVGLHLQLFIYLAVTDNRKSFCLFAPLLDVSSSGTLPFHDSKNVIRDKEDELRWVRSVVVRLFSDRHHVEDNVRQVDLHGFCTCLCLRLCGIVPQFRCDNVIPNKAMQTILPADRRQFGRKKYTAN